MSAPHSAQDAQGSESRPVEEDAFPCVVQIITALGAPPEGYVLGQGSAILINGCVVTAKHNVQVTSEDLYVRSASGTAKVDKKSIRFPNELEDSFSDIAVAKLDKALPEAYGTDILAEEPLSLVGLAQANRDDFALEEARKKGAVGTLVGFGGNVPPLSKDEQRRLFDKGTPAEERLELMDKTWISKLPSKKTVGRVTAIGTEKDWITYLKAVEGFFGEIDKIKDPIGYAFALATKKKVEGALKTRRPSQTLVVLTDGREVVKGDSGGPFFVRNKEGQWRLHGIVSRGDFEFGLLPKIGLLTPVLEHRAWLLEQLKDLGCAGD